MNSNNLTVTHGYEKFEPNNDIVEPKKAKMEKYSPTVTVPQTQNMSHNAGGLNASTRSSSPVEGLPLTIGHGMERDKDRATYLQQLIKDQKCCLSYPNVFHHVERLLSEGKGQVDEVIVGRTRPRISENFGFVVHGYKIVILKPNQPFSVIRLRMFKI